MTEQWLPCPGFEHLYSVSNHGNVMRTAPGLGKAVPGHILRPGKNPKGYRMVVLCDRGTEATKYIHRLVCEAFHGSPPSALHQAAHKNDEKTDNRSDNLYWATPLENGGRDRRKNGRIVRGEKIGRAKLNEAAILAIRARHNSGFNQTEIADEFGVAPHTISRILSGKRWGHVAVA